MKKVLFALSFMVGSVVAANAQVDNDAAPATQEQSTQLNADDQMSAQDENYTEKEAITASELPSNVSAQLQSDEYSSWTQSNVYKKEKDGETFYAVELTNGDEKKIVKFDAQGNKVKEKDKEDKK